MHRFPVKDLNFIEALFGLLLQPAQIVERLFRREPPPYAITLVVCLLLTIFTPIITQVLTLQVLAYRSDLLLSAAVFVVSTSVFLVIIMRSFFRLIQVSLPYNTMVRSFSYCLAPVILAIWSIYLVNYFSSGNLSVVTKLVTGYAAIDKRVLWMAPFAFGIANLSGLLIFYHCIRVAGSMHPGTAAMVTALAQIPFIFSFFLGLAVAEIMVPETLSIISELTPYDRELMSLFERLNMVGS